MKSHSSLPRVRQIAGVLCLASLCTAAPALLAAEDIILNTFATADEAAQWSRWWGAAEQTYEFDPTKDVNDDAGSGSLKVTVKFNLAAHGGDNQFAALRPFDVLDGTKYTNLVMDIYWDPSSPQRPFGDFGTLEPGFRNQDFSQNWLPSLSVPTNGGWIHLSIPINPTAPKLEAINGIVLKMWSGAGDWGQTGDAVFWVDNVKLVAAPEGPPPPPTLSIEKATPGLRAFASAGGAQYQRQGVRLVNPVYSWVDAAAPVSYSMTIADYPGGTYSGFQAHMFLAADANIPNTVTGPDWNSPHVVFVQIGNNADGSAYGRFMYKTNQPNGNGMYWNVGTLGVIGSPRATGTWTVTFNTATDITLTSPSGANTNFTMPADAAALFTANVYAYFGVQPNTIPNIGQSVTFSRIQITGTPSPIDETFVAPLDPVVWQVVADDPSGVVTVTQDALFWLNWTLPDRDWTLEYATDLTDNFWNPWSFTGALQIGGLRRTLIRSADLPPTFLDAHYFRLTKP